MPEQDDRLKVDPGTIHPDQIALILAACQTVMNSPAGCGEVRITIERGRIRFVHPSPSLDAYQPGRETRYLGQ